VKYFQVALVPRIAATSVRVSLAAEVCVSALKAVGTWEAAVESVSSPTQALKLASSNAIDVCNST